MSDSEEVEVYLCYRVCDAPNPHPEAVEGRCDRCDCKIYMMPGAPTRMRKLCHPCGMIDMIKAAQDGETEFTFLPGAEARKPAH